MAAPLVSSAVVAADGITWTVTWDQAVEVQGNADSTITTSNGRLINAPCLTDVPGGATEQILTFPKIYVGEVATITIPAGNVLGGVNGLNALVSAQASTNNSTSRFPIDLDRRVGGTAFLDRRVR